MSSVDQGTIDQFTMPVPMAGQTVRWWSEGVVRLRPVMATVVHVMPRYLELQTFGGQRKKEVRHCSDPKLLMNPDQRDDGCWDFTDEYYAEQRWRQNVDSRLDDLEARLNVKSHREQADSEVKDKKPTGFEQLAALRKTASSLGISFNKDSTKEELEAMIQAKSAPANT